MQDYSQLKRFGVHYCHPTPEFAFTNNPDSKVADELLEERLFGPKGTNEVVIVESETMTVDDPAFQEFVEQKVFGPIASLGPEVIKKGTLTNYYVNRELFLVSEDRALPSFPLPWQESSTTQPTISAVS